MATAEPLPPAYKPLLIGFLRLRGGDWQVTWSVAPGTLVRRTVPVEHFNDATLAALSRDVAEKHTQRRPNG